MRIVAHLIGVVLLLPGLFMCATLLSLGYLAAQPNMLGLINAMLDLALAFFPVVFLLFLSWLGIALMGFSTRLRRAGAISVAAIAAATTAFMLWRNGAHDYAIAGGAYVPDAIIAPGAFALAIGIWLASTEWPRPRAERRAAPASATLTRSE
jgi:hypothetical protein